MSLFVENFQNMEKRRIHVPKRVKNQNELAIKLADQFKKVKFWDNPKEAVKK